MSVRFTRSLLCTTGRTWRFLQTTSKFVFQWLINITASFRRLSSSRCQSRNFKSTKLFTFLYFQFFLFLFIILIQLAILSFILDLFTFRNLYFLIWLVIYFDFYVAHLTLPLFANWLFLLPNWLKYII